MIHQGLEYAHAFDSALTFKEVTAPGTPPANYLRFYAKDKAGVSALYLKDDAGSEREIGPANQVTGTGAANKIAYWTSSSVISSDTDLHWDATNNRLGIGTATPETFFHIRQASVDLMRLESVHATPSPSIIGQGARGTIGSESAVQANNNLLFLGGRGFGATAYPGNSKGALVIKAAENWSDSAQGTYLTFETTPIGSTTRAERFRIGPAGQWGIGGATFGSAGQYFRSDGASAAPTWATIDHGSEVGGLTDDDHTQYALLAGRSGGQTQIGGTAAADDLILRATAGVGAGSEAIIFQLGNNGASEGGRFAHTGVAYGLGVGTGGSAFAPIPSATLDLRNASSAQNSILLLSDGGSANLAAFEWRTTNGGIGFIFAKANGTVASPVALATDDNIFFMTAQGHKGGANGFSGNIATIRAKAMQTFTNTANGTRWEFSTTPNGSTAEVFGFLVPEDGGIAIQDGITAPATLGGYAKIYVDTADGDLKVKFGDAQVRKLISDGAPQTYTPTNVTTDRAYDANATTVDELADVLGTLILDLQTEGLIA